MDFFSIISTIFKYLFILVVYFFIANILKDILTYFYKESKTRSTIIRIYEVNKFIDIPVISHFTFGRAGDNDYIVKDQAISKHHFQIKDDGSSFYLIDLNSSNGTYLNSKKISSAKIKKGDQISFGGSDIKIEVMKWGEIYQITNMFWFFSYLQYAFLHFIL